MEKRVFGFLKIQGKFVIYKPCINMSLFLVYIRKQRVYISMGVGEICMAWKHCWIKETWSVIEVIDI